MFSGSLPSVLFSLSVGLIFLQIILFLYGVFKKKNGLIVLMIFTILFSIMSMICFGVWAIVDKAFLEKERTAEEQALYNQDIVSSIDINDFGAEDWVMIMRAANGDYTAYYPLLIEVFADDPEMLAKIEDYGETLEVKGLITEINELSANPVSYLLNYDGQIEEELGKTAEQYRNVASNLENLDIPQDENYQALYDATNELMTGLSGLSDGDVFTTLETELGSIEEVDLASLQALYKEYDQLLHTTEEVVLTNEEKITEHFNAITTDFEKDIEKALEVK